MTVFTASQTFELFDYFRIPYRQVAFAPEIDGCAALRWGSGDDARHLFWTPAKASDPVRRLGLGDGFLCGRVRDVELGDGWSALETLHDDAGSPVAAIRRDARGNVFLPFDPGDVAATFLSERYREADGTSGSRLAVLRRAYYLLRPIVPRSAQIAARRQFARLQSRAEFPRWPVESSLHDVYDLVLDLCASVAGEPLPRISLWPGGRGWAIALTHDVETAVGYEHIDVLRAVETELGYRSSWNLVARRYDVEQRLVDELLADGFEVGVHGLYHDGRDIVPRERFDERLPEMRRWRDSWHAVGFRAPALHREWETMPLLGFDYDSSYPDADPYEPMAGGCCSWLPFLNESIVELPVTLAQDHTLFVILRRDGTAWAEKARYLRDRGGMALIITHPDYMLDAPRVDDYRRLLEEFAGDDSAWRVLPRDVAAWWRRRSQSALEWRDGAWTVVGPAASEARVELVGDGAKA